MANRVGGISEYLDEKSCIIMNDKKVDDWVGKLLQLVNDSRFILEAKQHVAIWAKQFSWEKIIPQYEQLYCKVLEDSVTGC